MKPLTQTELKQFADDWYSKLDVHAPMVEILPLLADEELKMTFPEGPAYGYKGFEEWYQRVIRIFFDEVHTVKEVTPTTSGEIVDVNVVVQWEASMWKPPAAKSERINCFAYQRWQVKRSTETEKPIIVGYIVDEIEYKEGSARL
ncbi:hypothetical protein [Crocosphaera sp.]|uniref:hypothetical protein n=1 Tax=Crocosphaera sp. TaxID=2729996 RepID=UPI002633B0E8|nr:hypothetical protein [Crocosphaera sp.]MDJ0581608.1 hypothetical protein [Crocosphaera sp.]